MVLTLWSEKKQSCNKTGPHLLTFESPQNGVGTSQNMHFKKSSEVSYVGHSEIRDCKNLRTCMI